MVESSDVGELDDLPKLWALAIPSFGRIAGQRQMAGGPVVVLDVLRQDPQKVHLVQDYDVIEAATARPSETSRSRNLAHWQQIALSSPGSPGTRVAKPP